MLAVCVSRKKKDKGNSATSNLAGKVLKRKLPKEAKERWKKPVSKLPDELESAGDVRQAVVVAFLKFG